MSIDYRHPLAVKILDDAKRILSYSETAKMLENQLSEERYSIAVLATPIARPHVVQGHQIYLSVPATQDFADIEQAIDLAAAMHELKKNRESEGRPATGAPDDEKTLQKQHLFNLEIMLNTFRICQELDEGYKAVQSLKESGLGKLYKAWLDGSTYDKFVDIYWDML